MSNCNPKNELQEFLQRRGLPLPQYSLVRSTGLHLHTARVSVQWRNGETLETEGGGHKRKDAEMEAARKMLPRLMDKDNAGLGLLSRSRSSPFKRALVLASPSSSLKTPAESASPASPLRVPPVPSSPASPSNSKGRLQELLQRHGHRVPRYEVVRGGMNNPFTVKCTAVSDSGRVIAQENGNGRKKADAEKAAAESLFPVVEEILLSGRPLTNLRPVASSSSPPPEVVDHDLDVEMDTSVSRFIPQYQYQEGVKEEGGATDWLCLVSTGCEGISADSALNVPVTACGTGETKSQSRRAALCNLIDNLTALGYPVQ